MCTSKRDAHNPIASQQSSAVKFRCSYSHLKDVCCYPYHDLVGHRLWLSFSHYVKTRTYSYGWITLRFLIHIDRWSMPAISRWQQRESPLHTSSGYWNSYPSGHKRITKKTVGIISSKTVIQPQQVQLWLNCAGQTLLILLQYKKWLKRSLLQRACHATDINI